MRTQALFSVVALGVALLAPAVGHAGTINPRGGGPDLVPTGKGWGVQGPASVAKARPGRTSGIVYHGGPVMVSGVTVHYIWYQCGSPWSATQESILDNLAQSLGGSPYFNINTTYYDGSGTRVANSVAKAADATNNCSLGTSLTDSNIQAIVAAQNPTDTNGVYFVMTSADVNETSGFCSQYCGWHTHGSINGRDIKYAFVGNPARCPSSCTNGTAAPNGDVGADGAASIIAHELEEATTDPDLNAWYDRRGAENADKCAWTFGATYSNGTGTANMRLGSRDYLIQQNWVNSGSGFCALSF